MIFKRLEDKGIIEPLTINKNEIKAKIEVALRNLKTAKTVLYMQEWDVAHSIAYDAIKQVCLGFMHAYGYRPIGETKHKNTLIFAKEILDDKYHADIARADKMRKERNIVSYEISEIITEQKAASNVEFAERFTKEVIEIIKDLLIENKI